MKWWLCVCLLGITRAITAGPLKKDYSCYLEHPAVKKFQEYIQIDTSKEENIQYALEFWTRQAEALGLTSRVLTTTGKPVCIITVPGQQPLLPAIMLNSHMDVVSAEEEEWTYPPYSGHMDENGDIYGRGTQDDKDVAIQYLEAIARLKSENVTLLRTIHISLMPDEETGGFAGMKSFVHTDEFSSLNIGFALDEGLTSANNELLTTYVDRRPFQIEFVINGESGHGAKIFGSTAAEKLLDFIALVMKYREDQKKIMNSKGDTDYGSYTSVNINMIHGGVAANVIPRNFKTVIDMRLSTGSEVQEIDNLVQSWLDQTGANITKYIRREEEAKATSVDDSNPYWMALKTAVNEMGYNITPVVCPATTDMLYLRNKGIPALGFAPKTNTISRIHGKNEYLNVETFIEGIAIYENIIRSLGNLPDTEPV